MNYSIKWTFRNDHEWIKQFPDMDSVVIFVNMCGIVSHPDVVEVILTNLSTETETFLKEKQNV